ncbi:MAG: HD domain-containing protein [Cloacibacillus evryensis]
MEKKIRELFPEIEWIKDPELQAKVVASYVDALKTGGWEPEDMDKIPFTLLIPNCPFSYLEHVRGVTRVAKRAMDEFNAIYAAKDAKFTIDNDLLVAGALLHDVGKLVEYARNEKGETVKSANARTSAILLRNRHRAAQRLFRRDRPHNRQPRARGRRHAPQPGGRPRQQGRLYQF